jgi:H+/gluconate symporter-like permease
MAIKKSQNIALYFEYHISSHWMYYVSVIVTIITKMCILAMFRYKMSQNCRNVDKKLNHNLNHLSSNNNNNNVVVLL